MSPTPFTLRSFLCRRSEELVSQRLQAVSDPRTPTSSSQGSSSFAHGRHAGSATHGNPSRSIHAHSPHALSTRPGRRTERSESVPVASQGGVWVDQNDRVHAQRVSQDVDRLQPRIATYRLASLGVWTVVARVLEVLDLIATETTHPGELMLCPLLRSRRKRTVSPSTNAARSRYAGSTAMTLSPSSNDGNEPPELGHSAAAT